jgi:predicted transcriptional regulator
VSTPLCIKFHCIFSWLHPGGRLGVQPIGRGRCGTGTTLGVKVDELKTRLKAAARVVGRTPHWLVKQALISAVEHIERNGHLAGEAADGLEDDEHPSGLQEPPYPFLDFA